MTTPTPSPRRPSRVLVSPTCRPGWRGPAPFERGELRELLARLPGRRYPSTPWPHGPHLPHTRPAIDWLASRLPERLASVSGRVIRSIENSLWRPFPAFSGSRGSRLRSAQPIHLVPGAGAPSVWRIRVSGKVRSARPASRGLTMSMPEPFMPQSLVWLATSSSATRTLLKFSRLIALSMSRDFVRLLPEDGIPERMDAGGPALLCLFRVSTTAK